MGRQDFSWIAWRAETKPGGWAFKGRRESGQTIYIESNDSVNNTGISLMSSWGETTDA